MSPLIGVAVVVAGFLLRWHPLVVVLLAALTTGIAAHMGPVQALAAYGHAYNQNRFVAVVWLVLPVIGVLERSGLQAKARSLIEGVRAATAGRLLLAYFLLRQATAALGLTALGGHAQTVRPLVAPMAEAAAERRGLSGEAVKSRVRAHAAAADNIAVFFGEDIFIAMSSVLLIKGVLDRAGMVIAPLSISLWAIPAAIVALLVHGLRLLRLDARLARDVTRTKPST